MAGPLPIGEPWPANNVLIPISGWKPESFHIYVHVPFCRVRCGYCDFNTYTADELRGASREAFHEQILREITYSSGIMADSGINPAPVASIFFGGGTPTLFAPAQFEAILSELRRTFEVVNSAEVTVEANPDTVNHEYLSELVDIGVNRISFGVQSFDEGVLSVLDRSHDPNLVPRVVADAKSVGLEVSIDLIYGTPGETEESWRKTLKRAVDLETGHISAYSLIVETGTKLAGQIRRGDLPDIDVDFQADCFEVATDVLEAAGFEWYEVSNWARSEHQRSVHNLAYWQSRDWWGYGPGAHSHVAGNRWWNAKHPASYQGLLDAGKPVASGMERLTERQTLEERLLLELRTVYGVSLDVLRGLEVSPKLISQELADGNLRLLPNQRISVTKVGRLVADAVVVRLLGSR